MRVGAFLAFATKVTVLDYVSVFIIGQFNGGLEAMVQAVVRSFRAAVASNGLIC